MVKQNIQIMKIIPKLCLDIHNVPRGSDELGQLSIRLADKHKVKLSWLTCMNQCKVCIYIYIY
jgi:hypothetical protein